MMRELSFARRLRPRRLWVVVSATASIVALSCTENLPSGPATFGARIQIVLSHDTLVVGDSSTAQAQAIDSQGHVIQSLSFNWRSGDSTLLGLATLSPATPDASSGRAKRLVGLRTGRSVVTLSLPDPRFVVTDASRTETVVVDGVRVLTTRDSTLTAINDTAVAIGAGLVHVNGARVARASQGIRWIHLGSHTALAGQGDTVRYIARSNGPDTLIATHDFCLIGAKCADTVVVRVTQQLLLTLSARTFFAWSFGDTLGPSVTLADRRGNGQAGTFIRLVPVTAADSAIVKVTAPLGVSNPVTGAMAAPRLIATGNGTARVTVQAIAADGSVVAVDSIGETVRQVARRVAVEPLRALVTAPDSIPIKPIARDARGATIADATIVATASGITLNGIWAGPTPGVTLTTQASITPTLSGVAAPENNPLAPQITAFVDASLITLLPPDTAKAGATARVVSVTVLDSNAAPALGQTVRFRASSGASPDPVSVGVNGVATVVWTPPDTAGTFTLTGVRPTPSGLTTLADSAGRIVIRRSLVVIAAAPDASKSTLAISATTIATSGTATVTVTVKDAFGNLVKTAIPGDFTLTATRGTFGSVSCASGVCTVTYTAPATAGADAISVKIGGVEILNSPTALTIM